MDIAVSEFRQHIADWLDRAELGEEIIIRRNGKPIARLAPIADPGLAAEARLLAARKRCRIGDVISGLDDAWDADGGVL